MPKRITFSFAKLFAKPPQPALNHWPRKWPPLQKSRSQTPQRSQLRFTPIAAGKIEPWIFRLLMNLQGLLVNSKNEEALKLCHEELSLAIFHRGGQYDCFHRVISLFTRHGDFSAATSLCNRMIEEGFVIPKTTLMVLLRGMHSHDVRHIQQVQAMLTSGAVELDDLAFRSILDSMLLHGSPPGDLEAALRVFSASRGEGWVVPPSIYGTVIQSYALAEGLDRAQELLDEYRETVAARKPEPSPEPSQQATSDPSDSLETHLERKLRRRSGIRASTENLQYPYAAVLMGYVKSSIPLPVRVQWLFQRMQSDGILPDLEMCNMIIPTFFRWGWYKRAQAVYQSMLDPGSVTLPDAYTFRHLFITLNPRRKRGPHELSPPTDMSARQLFKDMILLDRLRLHPRKPQAHKNTISVATFNCALGTYTAQGDYAAAWTVLSFFTRFHICPDEHTVRNVILSLLRRMRGEMAHRSTFGDVIWIDRFMGQRRSTMMQAPDRKMLADHLFMIGRAAVKDLRLMEFETYLKPSLEIRGPAKDNMELLVALLRTSLRASLGFSQLTNHPLAADRATKAAMLQARSDMVPRGRSNRN